MNFFTRRCGLALLLLTQAVDAETDADLDNGPVQLSPIVVTATRTEQAADETLASVTVISREELELRQSTTVAEALNGMVGLQFSNNGGLGKTTSLFMRGTNSDHVLVLIDGVKVGSGTTGAAAFEHIPVDQIDHIEVVRGPRASLYGSEAIGGVIQIFTRSGKDGSRKSASISGGAHDYFGASASLSERFDKTWINLSANYERTAGINSCQGSLFGGCFTNEPDRDGYKSKSGSFRIGHQLTDDLEFGFNTLHTEGETDFDGSFTNETDFVQQVTGGSIAWDVTTNWRLTTRAGLSKDENENHLNGVFASRFDTKRNSRSVQSDYQLNEAQLITLGYDYLDDRITSSTAYAETSRRNEGGFGQYQLTAGRWSLQASARHDSNEQFGNHETGGGALGYFADNGVTTTVSYGTAYKAPSFNELYFPGFGNASLNPEESKTAELGISGNFQGIDWSSNFYQTTVDDLIAFDMATYAPANISEAKIKGVELQAITLIAGWNINTQFTFLDAKNEDGGPNHDNMLPRRARQSLRVDGDRRSGKWEYGGTLQARSNAYDDLANNDRIGGFVTVDLRGSYQLTPQFLLQGKVNNLLDKTYSTAANYNQDGANLMFTLRWQDNN
ncbi:MAG: TonB-dependent vitamin B12 receptor [Gammaproteobacteria bacterium]|nr:MAG: TonB-dependent vitamin B12 receptor [Gammaproteobacteria bacterium]RLA15041.1 MAG: TonB-dependent vitamin B12 receptor [Gammaproteobacteria bacterium]